MKKKVFIIIGIVILISLAIIGWSSKNSAPAPSAINPSPSTIPATSLAPVSTAPQQEFATDSQHSYQIVYDPNYNFYIISILNTPFDTIRLQAEQDLIKKLNISQDQACAKIKVHIGSPYFANPDQTQSYDTFSFCAK